MDDQNTQAERRVGRVLSSKWRLDRLLGVGGMAAVYEATHRNGMRGAVKVLHASLSGNTEARHRFLCEGYAANRVQHPGVVAVLDDDETEDGDAFLVMELLQGETLEARWSRAGRRMLLEDVLGVAASLLGALEAAHAADVVHRDVKPENVFVTAEGQIKLLDFGIARVREIATSSQRTQAGVAMGTPSFMPPEQARGRWDEVDARSDLWSVGATLFTLLSGRYVHDGETPNETLLSAMTVPAPSLAGARPDLPPGVVALVDRALAVDKEDRWPSAGAMLAAVQAERSRLWGEGPAASAVRGRAETASWVPGKTALALALPMGGASRMARSPSSWILMVAVLGVVVGLSVSRFGFQAPVRPAASARPATREEPREPSASSPLPAAEVVLELPGPSPSVGEPRAPIPKRAPALSLRAAPVPRAAPTGEAAWPSPSPSPSPARADPLGSRR